MQIGALLQALELGWGVEVLLHHIDEAIVVLHSTSGILDEQCSSFLEEATDLSAHLSKSFGAELVGVVQVKL